LRLPLLVTTQTKMPLCVEYSRKPGQVEIRFEISRN
jgi:hypothetical protein